MRATEISTRSEIAHARMVLSRPPSELSFRIAGGRLGLRESHKLSLAGCDSQAAQPNFKCLPPTKTGGPLTGTPSGRGWPIPHV